MAYDKRLVDLNEKMADMVSTGMDTTEVFKNEYIPMFKVVAVEKGSSVIEMEMDSPYEYIKEALEDDEDWVSEDLLYDALKQFGMMVRALMEVNYKAAPYWERKYKAVLESMKNAMRECL